MLRRNELGVSYISPKNAGKFLRHHHYLQGTGNWGPAFGLYGLTGNLLGVCTFGSASRMIVLHAFTAPVVVWELNRLALVPGHDPNLPSWFVGQCLRRLTRPCAVVSFADTAQGHFGYVYQASNFYYTGLTVAKQRLYRIGSELLHERALYNRGITNPARWAEDNGIEVVRAQPKHRYWRFLGTHKQKRWFLENLRYAVLSYPKAQQAY